jgi:hypothetical protein
VDSLAIGFTLNLLSKYAVAKPKIPLPRGKLNSFQLRSVVDFIQSSTKGVQNDPQCVRRSGR